MASQLVSSSSHLSDLAGSPERSQEGPKRSESVHVEVLGFLGVFSMSFCLFVAVAFQRLKRAPS